MSDPTPSMPDENPANAPDDTGAAPASSSDAAAASGGAGSGGEASGSDAGPAVGSTGEAPTGPATPEEAFAPPETPAEGADEAPSPTADPDEEAAKPAAERPASQSVRARARVRALARFAEGLGGASPEKTEWLVGAFERGYEPVYMARFRREQTGGMDENALRDARDGWKLIVTEEERREELIDLIRSRGALTPELEEKLAKAKSVGAMEDHAAPWLPVAAGRATVARGQGLQALADAILHAKDATPLSELAKPFVKEGTEVATLDAALGGARDILAESLALDATLRARLRELFRRDATLTVTLRSDKKVEPGRHGALVGFTAPARKVPPLKLLAIRRGERERVLSTTVEPAEAKALELVYAAATHVAGTEHPHAGFVRAAAEDGYRRLLRPMLSSELRTALKADADAQAIDTFERSLRNLLLGPVGGPRKTLGIQPDVTAGHRTGAVDEQGRAIHAGRLPHEATAGREAAVAALRELIDAHGVDVVAIGSSNGRRDVLTLVEEARKLPGREVTVAEVLDGGTRAIEAQAVGKPVRTEGGTEIPPEFTGALSIARRFQDPLAEYVRLDPKALGLGPNLHDVHQGRLKAALDDATASCVAHVGVDASTADAHLLACLPGMDVPKARAYVAWREAGGVLSGKAALGAVEGVGLAAAEQAVGFLRVPTSKDPRDKTQLHPEQFGLLDEMAKQLDTDLATLFLEPRARAAVDLGKLARPEAPIPTLKYVLSQAAGGLVDPRPRFAVATKPPDDVRISALRPGMLLEGRVTRAVPFGVFVDVGLGAEALIPIPHIGDHPGIDPATVAPVGAVVQARVFEIDTVKRRLTLSMRPERDGGRPRGGERRGSGGPRRDERGPRPMGAGGERAAGEASSDGRAAGGPRGERPAGGGRSGGGGGRGPREGAPAGRSTDRRAGKGQSVGGGGGKPTGGFRDRPSSGGAGGFGKGGGKRDEGRRFDRDDPGAPRRISLPMSAEPGQAAGEEAAAEALTPEQELARKLEELKRRIARPD